MINLRGMEKYFWLKEWVIGDSDTGTVLKNEHGEVMVFKSQDVALAVLGLLRSAGYSQNGNAVPYNHQVEAGDN